MTQNIEKLIIKYLTNSANANDLDILSEWIENPSNEKKFKDFVQTHVAINYSMNDPESEVFIEQLLYRISKEKSLVYKIKKQPIYRYAAAASILLIVTLTIFFNKANNSKEFVEPIIVNTNVIEPGTNKAILTLEDGSNIELNKEEILNNKNISNQKGKLIYNSQNSKASKIAYHYLTIPRGGEYFIKLSDGTKVWLNSESQLRYPEEFVDGKTRQVELIYGEAYFDVSPSAEHKGSKFKVVNNAQEVEVLGTEFNIKAYKDETNVYTTLVEGKVVVGSDNTTTKHTLKPNQQLNLDLKNNSITLREVDIKPEISWKNGIFSFDGKSLKSIMKVISRWYDVDVIFLNKDFESIQFKGNLNKNQSIERVLAIMKSSSINSYEINNKTIIIK